MTCEQQLLRSESRAEVEERRRELLAGGWYVEEVREITISYRRHPDPREQIEVVYAARAWKPLSPGR